MSPTRLARCAKAHGIPVRKGGGAPVDRVNAAARIATMTAPTIIRPALVGKGGWPRLQRFAAAARYPTLGAAAEDLRIHPGALDTQLRRLEHDLGTRLLVRAERGRPMRATADGARVAAAVAACESTGGPWNKHE